MAEMKYFEIFVSSWICQISDLAVSLVYLEKLTIEIGILLDPYIVLNIYRKAI